MRAALFAAFALLSFATAPVAEAASKHREDSIRKARVWQRPAWINEDFSFDPKFDIKPGPPVSQKDEPLNQPHVSCTMTEETAKHDINGQTMKFFCEMEDGLGKVRDFKMKYKFDDGEISGEILGTRLLWALGFPVDRMFLIDRLDCYGCTADPFHDRRVDPKSLETPRTFELAAAESKFPGKQITWMEDGEEQEGWDFKEFIRVLPRDADKKLEQQTQREAIRLLTVFLRHADTKPENQRLVCEGKVDEEGGCSGETVMLIQDLGLTFGFGIEDDDHVSKVYWKDWDTSPVWKDPAKCQGLLGNNHTTEMMEPVIREQGRAFLARLLKGFSDGPEGRKRVEDLFRSGHAELRKGTIEQWTNTFLRKVDEIAYPMGRANPDFRCPTSF